ncbi:protein of unknown function [Magnetospirillum gryphiswaldense MSR-1 v2]|uniref:Transposase DDE domain-containing protein n=1 Tax=Magnetospirillum gryphiswaldense (strain DSM 6361 / JCM 21280 / NBRC 15271 / MSR-1) TaxID=431944 RepID=V6EXR1_MAGGM|nr:protein of unknown function [Magnetospirillum gryphiswaldense MSR-1 v2]
MAAFHNQRGTAEQYIKEGENAVKWTRLSCRTMKANAVRLRLQLHALAYNLSNAAIVAPFRLPVGPELGYPAVNQGRMDRPYGKCPLIGQSLIGRVKRPVGVLAEQTALFNAVSHDGKAR